MKLSEKPANHILVRANCRSEWDNCDFAIIDCGENWVEKLKKRVANISQIANENDCCSLTYDDCSFSFYVCKDAEVDVILQEIGDGKEWAFVILEEDEECHFIAPETYLDSYSMVLSKDGTGQYIAYGEYTGEKFYTKVIPFKEILEQYAIL